MDKNLVIISTYCECFVYSWGFPERCEALEKFNGKQYAKLFTATILVFILCPKEFPGRCEAVQEFPERGEPVEEESTNSQEILVCIFYLSFQYTLIARVGQKI